MMDEENKSSKGEAPNIPVWVASVYLWLASAIKLLVKYLLMLLPLIVIIAVLIIWRNTIDWQILLDYTRTLIWPFVVIVALILFFRPVKNIMTNLKLSKFSFGKYTAELREDAQQDKPPPVKDALAEVTKAEPTQSSTEGLDVEQQRDKENFESLLVLYEFERAYRVIFGSQLTALQRLRQYKTLGAKDLMPFFEEHRTKAYGKPFYNDIFGLMGYLVSNGFVKYGHRNQTYSITDKGELFLNYLQDQNMSLNKSF